jgi:RHS repeat-associated protein
MKTHTLSAQFATALSILIVCSPLRAQVGSDNPNGVAGGFGSPVTTGGMIWPYTGSVTRAVTDISIAGAVGTIPLALTRIYDSRGTSDGRFGLAGNWRHSYAWGIPDSYESTSTNLPSSYTVNFPDGRVEAFSYSASDIYYRPTIGLRERFINFTGNPLLGYLVLGDGSKVEFKATRQSYFDPDVQVWYYWYTFTAQALIDPYGLRTSLTYNSDGTLQKVTEPAGRFLQFYYTTIVGKTVINQVSGSDGRTVQYYYSTISPGGISYVALTSAIYYGDSQWTASYTYRTPNVGSAGGTPLLWTANDPMYPGPMRRIAYDYNTGTTNPDGKSVVYGQIYRERYWDGMTGHEASGAWVTTLTIGATSNVRIETRGDGRTRTFTYTGYNLTSSTDFYGVSSSLTYDSWGYVNSVTDPNGNKTDLTINRVNGALWTTTFPATPSDVPPGTPRGGTSITYGSANCADTNNQDNWNPYYVCTETDEAGNVIHYSRDTNKRVTRIDYADTGYETFAYNGFGEVLSHRTKTGGTETFTYDASGSKMTYRDPYHASGNPSAWYDYDSQKRVSIVTDALGTGSGDVNHTTSFAYNARGQLTTTTLPVDGGSGHTIINAYNSDGTLQSKTDQLGHVWSYTYDDYRRLKSVTTPQRATGDNTPRTTYFYYDATGIGNDYTFTDANVTWVTPPSGTSSKRIKTIYDDNRRRWKVTLAPGVTGEEATTIYGYDNAGNVTSVTDTKSHATSTAYDERNRPKSTTDRLNQTITILYDTGGRKKKITRPNGQTITYDTFDAGNRVTQQTVTQTPEPDAITQYTYYTPADGASAPMGLLKSMRDPRLVAQSCSDAHGYTYDSMGRKIGMTYPAATCGGAGTSEAWHYDTAGRNDTFTNRWGYMRTLSYDALNRLTQSSWNGNNWTVPPAVTYSYDVASRLLTINNANANITRTYYNDNLLSTETQAVTGGTSKQVTYTYDADANRASIQYPGSYKFLYDYTNRNQLKDFGVSLTYPHVSYVYDLNGNISTATLTNATSSSYSYDDMDRVTAIHHYFSGLERDFNYGYDNTTGNRLWTKRTGNVGDVFGYDLNDQATAVQLNIANPDTTPVGAQSIIYDANGNRIWNAPYYPEEQYATNDLSQYSSRTIYYTGGQQTTNAAYDANGNMTTGLDGSTYWYDQQKRMVAATKNGVTMRFTYDGLNRQVTRGIDGGTTTYNVYDGWNLIEECLAAGSLQAEYYYGAEGLFLSGSSQRQSPNYWIYYYQNGEGSTSHIATTGGTMLEWYRYDLQGTPFVYNASDQLQTGGTNFFIRHLFTGQQWYNEIGLYDLRNRFYSPDIGRFVQPDPIGFDGDPNNLYRYCGNNPVTESDPAGQTAIVTYSGSIVNITIPIHFTGSGVTPAVIETFVAGIESFWSGSFGGYDVSTSVCVVGSGLFGRNTIQVDPGQGYMKTEIGGPLGYWHANGPPMSGYDAMFAAAHEIGHLLGLDDFYTYGPNGEIIPLPGFGNDIMGGLPGTKPSGADIARIIAVNQRGFFFGWGNFVSGNGLSLTTSNLFNLITNGGKRNLIFDWSTATEKDHVTPGYYAQAQGEYVYADGTTDWTTVNSMGNWDSIGATRNVFDPY